MLDIFSSCWDFFKNALGLVPGEVLKIYNGKKYVELTPRGRTLTEFRNAELSDPFFNA
jgi:hypothetical protein